MTDRPLGETGPLASLAASMNSRSVGKYRPALQPGITNRRAKRETKAVPLDRPEATVWKRLLPVVQ